MNVLTKIIDLLTGGLGGTAAGTVVGIGQITILAGMAGTVWLWTWEHRDAVFMVVKVSDLAVIFTALAFAFLMVWLAGRTRPRE